MNQRAPDGHLSLRDYPFHRSLIVETPDEIKGLLNSGGAGCFGKPTNYCQILSTLSNDGTSPRTGKTVLRKETVDEMFRNQIPELPNFAAVDYAPVKADLTNAVPHLYPSSSPQGWGLTFMVTGGERNWSLTRDCALGWAPELLVVV